MGDRADDTWEKSRRHGLWHRLTLRRADGRVYLDRWGLGHDRVAKVFVHRMRAPDPGVDLHDHPWWFVSLVLWGGYIEERSMCRDAPLRAALAESLGQSGRGVVGYRWPGSVKVMRKTECHSIKRLVGRSSWSLVVTGPVRRDRRSERSTWGFFLPSGWISEKEYDETVRADRRDLWVEK